MFNIRGRQRPVFSLSDIKIISEVSLRVFRKERIAHKNLKTFELQYGARINEINQQIFLVESRDWEINIDKYVAHIRALKWKCETQRAMESIFGSPVSVIDPSSPNANRNRASEVSKFLYDCRGLSIVRDKLPPGDHLCLVNTDHVPKDLICFAGFNSDILIEYKLNKFQTYKTGVSTAIAIVKV